MGWNIRDTVLILSQDFKPHCLLSFTFFETLFTVDLRCLVLSNIFSRLFHWFFISVEKKYNSLGIIYNVLLSFGNIGCISLYIYFLFSILFTFSFHLDCKSLRVTKYCCTLCIQRLCTHFKRWSLKHFWWCFFWWLGSKKMILLSVLFSSRIPFLPVSLPFSSMWLVVFSLHDTLFVHLYTFHFYSSRLSNIKGISITRPGMISYSTESLP